MGTFKHFSELNSWKASLELFRKLHYLFANSPKLKNEFELKSQMLRASLSIMNNIAEGFGRQSNREFIRFLSIARGSCLEVESMRLALEEVNLIDESESDKLQEDIVSIKGNLAGLSKYLFSTLKNS